VTAAAEPAVVSASPLAPFRHRAFFWLWLGVVVASVGSWVIPEEAGPVKGRA